MSKQNECGDCPEQYLPDVNHPLEYHCRRYRKSIPCHVEEDIDSITYVFLRLKKCLDNGKRPIKKISQDKGIHKRNY